MPVVAAVPDPLLALTGGGTKLERPPVTSGRGRGLPPWAAEAFAVVRYVEEE